MTLHFQRRATPQASVGAAEELCICQSETWLHYPRYQSANIGTTHILNQSLTSGTSFNCRSPPRLFPQCSSSACELRDVISLSDRTSPSSTCLSPFDQFWRLCCSVLLPRPLTTLETKRRRPNLAMTLYDVPLPIPSPRKKTRLTVLRCCRLSSVVEPQARPLPPG